MKKTIFNSVCLALILLITMGGTGMAIENVTLEEFLGKAGVPLAEIGDASTIEQFIEERELDSFILEEIPEEVLRSYIYLLSNGYPISYGALLEAETITLDDSINCSAVKQLALAVSEDASMKSLVVDFDHGRVYFSPENYIIDDVAYANVCASLDENLLEKIVEILKKADLGNVADTYRGDTEYRFGVVLALAFDEGVARFGAVGIQNGMPESMWECCKSLLHLFDN